MRVRSLALLPLFAASFAAVHCGGATNIQPLDGGQ